MKLFFAEDLMTEYRPREGVALLNICNTFLLVPTHAVFDKCEGVARISGMEAIFWRRLSEGAGVMDLCGILAALSFKQPEEVLPKVEAKLDRLYERGFLIKTDDSM